MGKGRYSLLLLVALAYSHVVAVRIWLAKGHFCQFLAVLHGLLGILGGRPPPLRQRLVRDHFHLWGRLCRLIGTATLPRSKSSRTSSLPSKTVEEGMMRQVWSNTADFITSILSGRERSCTKKDVSTNFRFQWKLSLCFSEKARVWRISMTSTSFPQADWTQQKLNAPIVLRSTTSDEMNGKLLLHLCSKEFNTVVAHKVPMSTSSVAGLTDLNSEVSKNLASVLTSRTLQYAGKRS